MPKGAQTRQNYPRSVENEEKGTTMHNPQNPMFLPNARHWTSLRLRSVAINSSDGYMTDEIDMMLAIDF